MKICIRKKYKSSSVHFICLQMADKDENEQRSDKNENSHEQTPTEGGSLETFITQHYTLQKVKNKVKNKIDKRFSHFSSNLLPYIFAMPFMVL